MAIAKKIICWSSKTSCVGDFPSIPSRRGILVLSLERKDGTAFHRKRRVHPSSLILVLDLRDEQDFFWSVLNRVGNLMKTVDFGTLREVKNICLGVETASKSCLTEKIRRQ